MQIDVGYHGGEPATGRPGRVVGSRGGIESAAEYGLDQADRPPQRLHCGGAHVVAVDFDCATNTPTAPSFIA